MKNIVLLNDLTIPKGSIFKCIDAGGDYEFITSTGKDNYVTVIIHEEEKLTDTKNLLYLNE